MCWNQTVILHGWMKSIHGVLFHVSFLRGFKKLWLFFSISVGNLKKDTLRVVTKVAHISKLDAYTIIIILSDRNHFVNIISHFWCALLEIEYNNDWQCKITIFEMNRHVS